MARAIEITFPDTSGVHRVRNFAEELSLALGELGDLGELPMAEADRATTRVVVANIPKRKLGRCRQLIDRLLTKHRMADEATLRLLPSFQV